MPQKPDLNQFKTYNDVIEHFFYNYHNSFGAYLSWFTRDELENKGRESDHTYYDTIDDINNFYSYFPNSGVVNLSDFNLENIDLQRYYLKRTARTVYRSAQLRNFANIFKFIYDKHLKDRSWKWIWIFPVLLSVLGGIAGSQEGFFTAIALMIFFPFSILYCMVSLLVIIYAILYAISFIYNLFLSNKYDKVDDEYYNQDIITQTINVIRNEQYTYLRKALSTPLPRIQLKQLAYQSNSSIPSNIEWTEEIAKESIAQINGSLYRKAIRYYGRDINKPLDINEFIFGRKPPKSALEIIGMSINGWNEIVLDIICIGFIRGASRSHSDFRCEYTYESRKKMVQDEDYFTKCCRHGLQYALEHFNISEEDWIELGEKVFDKHKVFERNKLKESGFIDQLPSHFKDAYIELL